MKTAVVYYTYGGSTRVAAEVLAKQLSADVFELEEVKKRGKSALSFMTAGFGALAGKRSRIKSDFAAEMKNYDCLYIGSPVWANKTRRSQRFWTLWTRRARRSCCSPCRRTLTWNQPG